MALPLSLALLTAGLVGGGVFAHRTLTRRVRGTLIDSGRVRIHFTDEGSGPPVVLIHGFAVNADLNWRLPKITQALAADFRVVSMDTRGHGLSGKPHDPAAYGVAMVGDVVNVLDHLGLERAHVVGYSLGGFIALKMATLHPDRLLSASVLGAGWERVGNSTFLDAISKLAADLEAGRAIGPLSGHLGAERRRPSFFHTAWVMLMTKYFNDPHALIGVIKGTLGLAVTEEALRAIPIPVSAICGSEDPLLEGARLMEGVVPDYSLTVISGADHVQAPRRAELREALSAFLHAHPPA